MRDKVYKDVIQLKITPEDDHVCYQYTRDSAIPQYVSLGWKTGSGRGQYIQSCSGALVQIGRWKVVLTIADCATNVNKHSSKKTPAYALFSNGIEVPIRVLLPHKQWKSPFGKGSNHGTTYTNQIAVVFLALSSQSESSLPKALTLPESDQNAGSGELIGLWVPSEDQASSIIQKASTVSKPQECRELYVWDLGRDWSYLCVVV